MAAVHVVNPGKRKRKGKGKKTKAKRRATPNPPAAANPKRRRKRRSTKNPGQFTALRSRAREAGGKLLSFLQLKQLAKEAGSGIAADLLMGFVVKRFGDPFGQPAFKGGASSPYAGAAWSLKNYAYAGGALMLASWVGTRFFKLPMARDVLREGLKSLVRRGFYTEIAGRSKWMQDTFGAAMRVMEDGRGNRWAELPDGTQITMAGLQPSTSYGALVGADQYGALDDADEFYGDDVEVMDDDQGDDDDSGGGPLQPARAIDAGGFDAPGLGRRYYPPKPGDQFARNYSRFAAYGTR